MSRITLAVLIAAFSFSCGDDGDVGEPPLFPDDYAATYEEVRNCRFSLEHDLQRIRVLAAPDAVTPYRGRAAPFPVGAIVLKLEYEDIGAGSCDGKVINHTVMQKLDIGADPAMLDWAWQEVGANGKATARDPKRCVQCHSNCGMPPEGYAGTCAVP